MGIAWQSFVTALLLIPGFLAVVGFYGASRAARDATPKSRLSEIAVVVFVSFLVHGLFLSLSEIPIRSNALTGVFATIRASLTGESTLQGPFWPVYIYFILTAVVGLLIGVGGIWLIERRRFTQPLLQFRWFHGWSYDYVVGKPRPNVRAHVLTTVGGDDYRVVYSGICYEMTLDKERNVMLVVLTNVRRIKLLLERESEAPHPTETLNVDRLVIPGPSIANIAFDTVPPEMTATPAEEAELINLAS
jgi:hypothetical protein